MSAGIPETPAGRRLAEVLDGLADPGRLDTAAIFHPDFLKRIPPDIIAGFVRQFGGGSGRPGFVADDTGSADERIVGRLAPAGIAPHLVTCEVEHDPPHRITMLFLTPVPFDVATLDDVPGMLAHYNCAGLTAALALDGEIAWARGWGTADASAGRPMTADTLVQVGSISKPVAAAAAMMLVEQGVLDLDTDVNTYLRAWSLSPTGRWQPVVTLRRILTHTAALSVWGFPGYARDAPSAVDVLDGK